MLDAAAHERYARHLSLPGFGPAAQERLLAGSALLVGAGGLGSPIALYLAAAGVGRLTIIDDDLVDRSNLQRQVLHRDEDVGRAKCESARRALLALNPEIEVVAIRGRFNDDNAQQLVAAHRLVIDGADNFPTRYLVNDAAVLAGVPVVHGSIFHFEGQATVFHPAHGGPCYRCLYPTPPEPGAVPSCAEAGVLGVLPGLVGMIQATEAIKLLTGIGEPLRGRLVCYDALSMRLRELSLMRDPACPLCGDAPTITRAATIAWACASDDIPELQPLDYAALRAAGTEHLLLDVREPYEVAAGAIPGHVNIPLGELSQRLGELEPWRQRRIVCQCQKGGRSRQAAELLRAHGFTRLDNLAGGWLAWRAANPEA